MVTGAGHAADDVEDAKDADGMITIVGIAGELLGKRLLWAIQGCPPIKNTTNHDHSTSFCLAYRDNGPQTGPRQQFRSSLLASGDQSNPEGIARNIIRVGSESPPLTERS